MNKFYKRSKLDNKVIKTTLQIILLFIVVSSIISVMIRQNFRGITYFIVGMLYLYISEQKQTHGSWKKEWEKERKLDRKRQRDREGVR